MYIEQDRSHKSVGRILLKTFFDDETFFLGGGEQTEAVDEREVGNSIEKGSPTYEARDKYGCKAGLLSINFDNAGVNYRAQKQISCIRYRSSIFFWAGPTFRLPWMYGALPCPVVCCAW